MSSPHTLTAADAARMIRAGDLSPIALVEACLAQITRLEPAIRAWVHVDEAGAREAAAALEAEARADRFRGPLHGVPVGLKDIFHVAGMVTTSGASAFAHERPDADADAVARLRRAGAIILGKTATTEFAYADPTVTRNPWHLEHTPGGSSSGSAAAVAARMIPLALGSQTIGSTLRPAAYCGIVGLKPTYGLISVEGVTPLAWSLDHVGIFARSVEDAALVLAVLAGDAVVRSGGRQSPSGPSPPADPPPSAGPPPPDSSPPRLGIPRALFAEKASPQVHAHLDAVAAGFTAAGAVIEEIVPPPSAAAIYDAGLVVLRAEAAAYHAARFAEYADAYRPRIKALVEAGLVIPAVEYVRAQQARQRFRDEMGPVFERFDALLLPVAPAPAPRDLTTTGDPVLCGPWSFGGFPAVALPSGIDDDGLPVAVQLVSGAHEESRLLRAARWCEGVLRFAAAPPLSGAHPAASGS